MHDPKSLLACLALSALALAASPERARAVLVGPTPYLDASNSPFETAAPDFALEDFEDGTLGIPGVTASAGAPIGPGPQTDSVDGDDGAIDGLGRDGHSFFSPDGPAGITFTFDPLVLGGLPTEVGIVWTDGEGEVTFEAFDADGLSLGVIGPVAIGDGAVDGGTLEDRFFGVSGDAVSAIHIANTAGGIEVDHLQLGGLNRPPDCSGAFAAPDALWPPDHRMAPISVLGIVDPDGDPLTLTVAGIGQDEPVDGSGDGSTCPDGLGVGTALPSVRVERSGQGDGRVYAIEVLAEDGRGGACTAVVTVCVPHDQGHGDVCGDQGPLADSSGLACIDHCDDDASGCAPPECQDDDVPHRVMRRLVRAGQLLDRAASGHAAAARRASKVLTALEPKLSKLEQRGRIDRECADALVARAHGAARRAGS